MDNSNQYWKVEEVLAHCSHQVKRIKKLTRSANTFAKHTKAQGGKVQLIANETAHAISSDFSSIQFEPCTESSEKIQNKLDELITKSQRSLDEDDRKVKSNNVHEKSKEMLDPLDTRLPTLPSALNSLANEDGGNDDVSDSGSDFFPDWSSVDSCTSSICSLSGMYSSKLHAGNREEIYLNDEDFLKLQSGSMDMIVDESQSFLNSTNENNSHRDLFNKGECTMMVLQPVPAAGNEPGTSTQTPPVKAESTLPIASEVNMKPFALRRVKSMVMDSDLQDSMEMGKKMYQLQQKKILSSMTAHPSPLLASDDVVHVKKSPSQTSAKYSLKRSRSNISAELSSAKRNNMSWCTEAERDANLMESIEDDDDVPMEDGFLPP